MYYLWLYKGLYVLLQSLCYREHAGEHGGFEHGVSQTLRVEPSTNTGMEFTGPELNPVHGHFAKYFPDTKSTK